MCMLLLPVEIEWKRLRYEGLHINDFTQGEFYKYAHTGVPHIGEKNEHVN